MALRLVCIVRKGDAWGRCARMAGGGCEHPPAGCSFLKRGCLMGGAFAARQPEPCVAWRLRQQGACPADKDFVKEI